MERCGNALIISTSDATANTTPEKGESKSTEGAWQCRINIFRNMLTWQNIAGPGVISLYGRSTVSYGQTIYFLLLERGKAYGAQAVLQIFLQLWVPTCPGVTGNRQECSIIFFPRHTASLPPERSPRGKVVLLVCPRCVKVSDGTDFPCL